MKTGREIALESYQRIIRASRFLGLLLCLAPYALASAAEVPARTFELTITRSAAPVKSRVLHVEKDDVVRLRVMSEEAGEIHLHGYRLALKLAPGIPGEMQFKARATGRFRIEWHGADAAAKPESHHSPPLAVLEVRPK
jgi:hypothetical protein